MPSLKLTRAIRLKSILLFLSVLVLSLSSCEKAPERVPVTSVTGEAVSVSYNCAVLTGNVIIPGSVSGITIGIHFSLSEGMLTSNSTEVIAVSPDKDHSFFVEVEGLKSDTKYYYRTFAKESDVYTFGETKSFTTAKAPIVKLSSESASFDFMEHDGSVEAMIENPAAGCALSASTADNWITDVKVSGNTVNYNVAENNSGAVRTGMIKLTYGPVTKNFSVTQTYSATNITFTPTSQSTDYAAKNLSFTFAISNPRNGATASASTTETWITEVKLSGTTVSYKVAENNSGAQRTGKIKLTYGTVSEEFSVSQTYTAPVITFTPASQSTDYTAKSLSFTFSVDTPRQGATASASTTDNWITDIKISGNTVSYRIEENNSEVQRTGKIKVAYGPVTEDFSVIQEYSDPYKGHEYVDLGLSVKWATCNVGASKPEDYGGYYQWAGIQDVSDTSIYLDWSNCPYHIGSDDKIGWTKYVSSVDASCWSGDGSPDNKRDLDPGDDVAHVSWGGNWRMPTVDELDELWRECSWTWTTINGKNGYKVQSKKPGYTDKWIFLPAAGYRYNDKLSRFESVCAYSSSTLYTPSRALCRVYGSGNSGFSLPRSYGQSVRPVSE